MAILAGDYDKARHYLTSKAITQALEVRQHCPLDEIAASLLLS
jgi:predicted transcriptional regulator